MNKMNRGDGDGDKSYASMEQKLCVVCCETFDTGSILLDRRLQASMKRVTVTDYGLCPKDQAKFDEGYVALVEVDESKSKASPDGKLKMENAHRTGRVLHIRRKFLNHDYAGPMMFCDKEVVDNLLAMMPPDEDETVNDDKEVL
jgi:hypothetical protein